MSRIWVLVIILVALLLVEWYSFQAIKLLAAQFNSQWRKLFQYSYVAISCLVVLAFLVYNFFDPDWFNKHVRTFLLSFIFINFLSKLFIVIFLLFDDIQRGIRWMYQKFSKPDGEDVQNGISRSTFLATTGVVIASIPFVSLSWGIISGAHDYRIRKVKLPIKDLPKGLEGFKIGQISDIHSGSFWNRTAVKGGVEMFLKEAPDLILFTGDLVNNKAKEMQDWGSVFSNIKAPYGVYSVLGNHDYGDYISWESPLLKQQNLKNLMEIQKTMGWELLMNENKHLKIEGEKIGIVGVENWSAKGRFPKYGDLNKAMTGLEDTSFNILLSHDPSHWREEVISNFPQIHLTLSGHTHGMQFGVEIPGFKWSPVQYMYDEWAGLYQSGQQYLYVNRGFGYIGYPGRVGIAPEVTIITLERA